jgi:hypothetical protein
MTQEINFLTGIPREPDKLSPKKMTYIIGAILLFFLLISMVIMFYINQLVGEEQKIINQKIKAEISTQLASHKYPLLVGTVPLATRVIALQKELSEKQLIFDKLMQKTNRLGFSNYLQSISEITPQGLWLNHILIDQNAGTASIRGFALAPESVPIFLKGLQNSHTFNHIAFSLFYMEKIPKKEYIKFEVANLISCNKKQESSQFFLCEEPEQPKETEN